MPYVHLNAEDRVKLEAWKEDAVSNGEIARRLGCHRCTVGRELARNGDAYSSWYVGRKAEKARLKRRRDANKFVHDKLLPGSSLVRFAEKKLWAHWSPEQIAGRLKRLRKETKDRNRPTISHERIYDWIYHDRKDLIPLLRHSKKRRHRRKNGTKQREKRREEDKKRRIDTRPKEIERRTTIGHWEGDTVLGKVARTPFFRHTFSFHPVNNLLD